MLQSPSNYCFSSLDKSESIARISALQNNDSLLSRAVDDALQLMLLFFGENWGIVYITNSDRRSDDRKYVCGSLATPQGTVDGFQSGQKTEDCSVTFSYPKWPAIKAYLQSVVLKTGHSKTKTEARITQNSKTKHPNL